MKKLIFSTLVGSLLALAGCQQNEEIMDNSQSGEKVTVTANIKGSTNGRVALTPDTEEIEGTGTVPIVKVDWRTSGDPETFLVFNSGNYVTFTQVDGTSQFTGTLTTGSPGLALYGYTIKNNQAHYDLSAQNGTLDEKNVVMLGLPEEDENGAYTFSFEHETFILKPTFKINGSGVNSTISQIVMGGLAQNVKSDDNSVTETTVTPNSLQDIYIFIMGSSSHYVKDHVLTFEVTAGGKKYEGTYTLTNDAGLKAGKLYTAEVTLTEKIPYVTFSAAAAQQLFMTTYKTGLQYSLNGGEWTTLNAPVNFGGTLGDLRLKGTLTNGTDGSNIRFSYDVPVACTGDIRTLIAGENYYTILYGKRVFKNLFKNCTQLTSAPELPLAGASTEGYKEMFYNCKSLKTAPELPATTLSQSCYESMFINCTSLTTAPVLPATKLVRYCYRQMFSGCSSLNSITMLATDISESGCFTSWVTGVASTGTFTKAASMTTLPENSTSGIPSGWTVVSQ